jgi:hypothetical protein
MSGISSNSIKFVTAIMTINFVSTAAIIKYHQHKFESLKSDIAEVNHIIKCYQHEYKTDMVGLNSIITSNQIESQLDMARIKRQTLKDEDNEYIH